MHEIWALIIGVLAVAFAVWARWDWHAAPANHIQANFWAYYRHAASLRPKKAEPPAQVQRRLRRFWCKVPRHPDKRTGVDNFRFSQGRGGTYGFYIELSALPLGPTALEPYIRVLEKAGWVSQPSGEGRLHYRKGRWNLTFEARFDLIHVYEIWEEPGPKLRLPSGRVRLKRSA